MSEEQQNEVIGRTFRQYQAAKTHLAALHAETERIGALLAAVGSSMTKFHTVWIHGQTNGAVEFEKWPSGEALRSLAADLAAAQSEKDRLNTILKNAGFEQA